ncbi:MAG: hypothetical protein ACM338_04310 [Betaproteobacteria bacterium]
MGSRFDDADYQLRWPHWLFVQEASRLLNVRDLRDWDEHCELLLEDAFVGGIDGGPLSEFREVRQQAVLDAWDWATGARSAGTTSVLTASQNFLRRLMQAGDRLREDSSHRKPYWSQRKTGTPAQRARFAAVVRQFVALVAEFEASGYLEKRFGKDCVDSPSEIDPAAVIEHEIGIGDVWPLEVDRLAGDLDLFCDVVEVLHDLVARPEDRRMHSYGGCGWYHSGFSIETGRAVYRWRVNQLLARSELGLRLADNGEDVGRIVETTEDDRADLLEAIVCRDDGEVGDQVRHAAALFRARGADKHQKRSAVVVLAHVLEERRSLIKEELLSKDEGALFMVANQFRIRHQNELQRSDYDPVFLDWLFWWYLATIDLTDHLAARTQSQHVR